jgi:hypothetical protein
MMKSFGGFGKESSKSKGKKNKAGSDKMNENAMADFEDLPSGSFESAS